MHLSPFSRKTSPARRLPTVALLALAAVMVLFAPARVGLAQITPASLQPAAGPLTITSFSPASGAVGATVVIKGTNFVVPFSLTFGGNVSAAGSFTATKITATVPSGAQTGKITVTTNNGSASTATNFTVTTGSAPGITSSGTASATEGASFSYQIVATNQPTRYGVLGLTPGLHVDAATGRISGTPTTSGTANLTLKATNANGTGQKAFTLTIAPTAPVITSAGTAAAKVGKAFSYTITAIYQPQRYGVLGLSPGLSVNATTGVISGSPTKPGTVHMTLRAINAKGMGIKPFTLTIGS